MFAGTVDLRRRVGRRPVPGGVPFGQVGAYSAGRGGVRFWSRRGLAWFVVGSAGPVGGVNGSAVGKRAIDALLRTSEGVLELGESLAVGSGAELRYVAVRVGFVSRLV